MAYVQSFAFQHLEQYDSNCPNIAFLAVCVLFICFRGHISWRPNIVEHVWLEFYFICDAVSEINEYKLLTEWSLTLYPMMFEDEVVRLDVPMDYFQLRYHLIAFHYLSKVLQRLRLVESMRVTLDQLGQSTSHEHLHGQIAVLSLEDNLIQLDDMAPTSFDAPREHVES